MSQIIYAPAIPTLNVGGRVFTDLTNLIVLQGHTAGAGATSCSPRLNNTSAGYSVTATKTLTILAVAIRGVVASGSYVFGYCDNDIGLATVTAPTNPVYMTGSVNDYTLFAGTTNIAYEQPLKYTIPAGKFLYVVSAVGSASIHFYGYEA